MESTPETKPVRPPHMRGSRPSPRKVKTKNTLATTCTRLAEPLHRETNNRNSNIDDYGERKHNISNIESYYSGLLDDISDQVRVPSYMRHKMIFAVIEAEKPHVYHAMKHFHQHHMTSSEARQARVQRQKADMRKPPTLQQGRGQGTRNYYQSICIQDDIKAQELFTEKLIKVSLQLFLVYLCSHCKLHHLSLCCLNLTC